MNVADLLRAAGPLLWVLVALSVYVVYLTVLRWQALRRLEGDPTATFTHVQVALLQHDVAGAQREAAKLDTPAGSVLWAGLDRAGAGRDAAVAAMNEALLNEDARLYSGLGTLGTIAQIAPLLGLLGTVIGMVRSFVVFSTTAQPTPAQLGTGISEALVNTAAGLVVAILAYVARNTLRARADRVSTFGERARESLLASLSELGAPTARPQIRPADPALTDPVPTVTPTPVVRYDFDKGALPRDPAERST